MPPGILWNPDVAHNSQAFAVLVFGRLVTKLSVWVPVVIVNDPSAFSLLSFPQIISTYCTDPEEFENIELKLHRWWAAWAEEATSRPRAAAMRMRRMRIEPPA